MRPCYDGRKPEIKGRFRTLPHGVLRDLPVDGYEKLRESSALEQSVKRSNTKSRLAAVKLLLANMPSLRKGWLWDEVRFDHCNCTGSSPCRSDVVFARCGWEVKETRAGGSEVVLDSDEVLLDQWVVNLRL
jgi:hypothetical protein